MGAVGGVVGSGHRMTPNGVISSRMGCEGPGEGLGGREAAGFGGGLEGGEGEPGGLRKRAAKRFAGRMT